SVRGRSSEGDGIVFGISDSDGDRWHRGIRNRGLIWNGRNCGSANGHFKGGGGGIDGIADGEGDCGGSLLTGGRGHGNCAGGAGAGEGKVGRIIGHQAAIRGAGSNGKVVRRRLVILNGEGKRAGIAVPGDELIFNRGNGRCGIGSSDIGKTGADSQVVN